MELITWRRVQIQNKGDIERVNQWIVAILILHNMVLKYKDNWDDEVLEDECENYHQEHQLIHEARNGRELREFLKEKLLYN